MTSASSSLHTDTSADKNTSFQTPQHTLYTRNSEYIPRVAAVHDMCGYGKCSLGVAIPVLSAAGIDVCPVPTAIFSAHTRFPSFYMHDTTCILNDYLTAWESTSIQLDGVYSGFLGSSEQVAIIQRLWQTHPNALRLVDPVMGDGGKAYPTYTLELCQAMEALVHGAHVLTPNLTEAALLTHSDYQGQDVNIDYLKRITDKLFNMGTQHIVIKGIVHSGENIIRNYIASQDNAELIEVQAPLLPFMLHGTGDLFASCVCSAIFAGKDLVSSVDFASHMVYHAMQITRKQPDFEIRGVSFELVLSDVAKLIS